MIKNRLVHFETQAEYLAKKNDIDFNAIVFVDQGRKIYTHGEEYGGDSIDKTDIYNKFETLEALYNQVIGNIGSSDLELTDPSVGQILMYNTALEKWVNVSPKILKDTFVTVGTSTDNDDQTIYGKKTFADDTYFKKLTGGPIVSTEIINSVYGSLEDGGDYILCADGSVKNIYDIIRANPNIADTQHRVVISNEGQSNHVSWKVAGIDSQFVNGLRIYSVVDEGHLDVEFSAQEGYVLDYITINNQRVNITTNSYTIGGITEDTVVKIFAKSTQPQQTTKYNLVINAQHASWKVAGIDSSFVTTPVYNITEGNQVTITFKADDGYRIDYINPSGSTANVGTNYVTFPGLFENSTITLTTSSETETPKRIVKVQCGSNGSVDGKAYKEYEVNDGGSIAIQFTPHEGYEIDRIRVNNVYLDTITNPLILTEINKTTEVYVLFKPMESTPVTKYVGVTCGRNGYAVFNGHVVSANTFVSFSVTSGDSATVTAVPNSGYEIDSITVMDVNNNVTDTTSEDIIEISNIRQNLNVRVTFKETSSTPVDDGKRTVTINGGNNFKYHLDYYDPDSLWNTTTKQYNNIQSGSQIELYVQPNEGYKINSVKVGNTTISPTNASTGLYKITVIADSTIQITAVQESVTPDVLTIQATNKNVEYWVSSYDTDPNEGGSWKDTDDTYTIRSGQSQVIIYVRGKSGYNVTKANGRNVINGQVTIPASEGTVTFTVEQIPTTAYPKIQVNGSKTKHRVYGTGISNINSTEAITVDSATWITNTENSVEEEIYRIIPGGTITIDFKTIDEYQLDCICISQEGVSGYQFVYPEDLTQFTESGELYYRYVRSNESSVTKLVWILTNSKSDENAYARPNIIPGFELQPVYYGFAGSTINSTDDIPQYAYGAAEDENTEYTSTATSTNKYWWLAVPKNWGTPVVTYKQGGMGVDMELQNGIGDSAYNIYRSRSFRVTGASTDYTFVIN